MKLELINVKNGTYKLGSRLFLKSGKADGTYAAWAPSKYSPEMYMLPATAEIVAEFNRLYSDERRIDVAFYLKQCYNKGKLDLSVFEAAIQEKLSYTEKITSDIEAYENCIKNAIPAAFQIIGEGVWREVIESSERSRDVFHSSLYKYYVLQLDCGVKCVVVGEKLSGYAGEYVSRLPFERAHGSLNGQWRMGNASKYVINFEGNLYYINQNQN